MSARPRLLDLFCGAGGAAVGYQRAGFDVVGVDIEPQPRYPFPFLQADAVKVMGYWPDCSLAGEGFDAIHASPPCQAFTAARVIRNREHPDLLTPCRELLKATGLPWVIENVPGAPMRKDLILCGTMFGLVAGGFELRRHRWFEFWDASYAPLASPCSHRLPPMYAYGHSQDNAHKARYGPQPIKLRRESMGTPWMTRDEVAQTIPPAFTEYIGRALLDQLRRAA